MHIETDVMRRVVDGPLQVRLGLDRFLQAALQHAKLNQTIGQSGHYGVGRRAGNFAPTIQPTKIIQRCGIGGTKGKGRHGHHSRSGGTRKDCYGGIGRIYGPRTSSTATIPHFIINRNRKGMRPIRKPRETV